MTLDAVGRYICTLAMLCVSASDAAAQATHADWLTPRTAKQARHHRLTVAATRWNTLTITTIRFYSDPGGNLVGVGEARNDSGFNLSYSRINFRFFDSNGEDLGGEWTYLFGGTNNRIVNNGAYETVLARGSTGFFKVWTTIPRSSMSSYTAATAGEDLPFAAPRAAGLVSIGKAPYWDPTRLDGQRLTGIVVNDDPFGIGCPCGHPQVFTYAVRVSVAAYQDGVITDVQSTFAVGPKDAGALCNGESATGMSLHQRSTFAIDLARPANWIGNEAVEWEEMDVRPSGTSFSELGGQASFTVDRQCGWTASSNNPWISVIEGETSTANSGRVTFRVDRNFDTSGLRHGVLDVSGFAFLITQAAACPSLPRQVFVGPGLVRRMLLSNVPRECSFGAFTNVPWLSVTPNPLLLSVLPNLSGITRSGVVTVGRQSVAVRQSAASRTVDFNQDGWLDLLWYHRADGRIATWRLNGVQVADGALLTPAQVSDTSWVPVTAMDMNSDGSTDVLWQHAGDGRLSLWRMADTVMRLGDLLATPRDFDPAWKVRGASDFNQDGDPDVVWQHERTGHIAVWLMRAGGSLFEPHVLATQISGQALGAGQVPDVNWLIVGTGDFNRDGWPDLVWQHQGDGRIAVWKMHGTTLMEGDLISPGQIHDLDWKIRGVGDINGDDWPDLIWQHRISGDVSAWLMNGTTMMAGVPLGQVPDTNWHIVGPR